jgi:hypothetical protein
VKRWDAPAVGAMLDAAPELAGVRDERGRNWLHVCCGVALGQGGAAVSIATADALLTRGFDINAAAFTEGDWQATPLWYAIGRGRNLALAEFLLQRGSNPNYCLWAASYNGDLEAIALLLAHGADLEDPSVPHESPFIWAISCSHFATAEAFLKAGANVDALDKNGMTALHLMLKKGSDKKHFAMLIAAGARGDIPNKDGVTAAQILRRKQDPDFRRMADQLR